jgi:hypothetical protein
MQQISLFSLLQHILGFSIWYEFHPTNFNYQYTLEVDFSNFTSVSPGFLGTLFYIPKKTCITVLGPYFGELSTVC